MKKICLLFFALAVTVWNTPGQYRELSKAGWRVTLDSEETIHADNRGIYAIDENVNTIWHTDWDDTAFPLPHWIIVDFGKKVDLSGFTYTPRQSGENGTVKTYAFFVSVDSTVWDSVTGGIWASPWDQKRTVTFDVHEGVRYMKLVAKEEANGRGWTSCAEFGAIATGVYFTADKTQINAGDSVRFTDLSDNDPVSWEWYFEGGAPETSTEQNPVVTYSATGSYDVRLVIETASGRTDTLLKPGFIRVVSSYLPQSLWSLLYVDSQETEGEAFPNGFATAAFDGDPGTFWHTKWVGGSDPYPHTLVLDLGVRASVDGFVYTPRPGGGNGTVKDYEFFVLKEAADWTDPTSWGTPAAAGTWTVPWEESKTVFLQQPVMGRYVIFHALSEKNNNAWTSCGELNVIGRNLATCFNADRTRIFATQKVQFTDCSTGKNAWEWTFAGGIPSSSTEQNPMVLYNAPGQYTVTLVTYSDEVGNDTLVKENYIRVDPRPTAKTLPKGKWSLTGFDSEERTGEPAPNGFAVAAIDGNPATYWHTDWTTDNKPYPHFLLIDLGETADIAGFIYTPRPGSGKGTVDSCAFLVSGDGVGFDTVALCDWSGLGDWDRPRQIHLNTTVQGRYVKFVALSEKKERPWASCGEIDVLTPIRGAWFEADPVSVESGGRVYFLDMTAGAPASWQWSFGGAIPPESTEQSPVVTYKVPYQELGRSYDVTLIAGADTVTRKNLITVDYKIPDVNPGVWIDSLQIGDVLSSCSGSEGGYVDRTELCVTLVRGRSYTVRLGHDSPWQGYSRSRGMYVDWNRNYHFDRAAETVFERQGEVAGTGCTDVFTLSVPSDAVPGFTRMRVTASVYGSPGPYEDIPYGEMEDYTVNIVDDTVTVAPVAAFERITDPVCAGRQVWFRDMSENLPEKWRWIFEGATPDTGRFATMSVVYPHPGTYSVTLVVSNDHGTDTLTKKDYITVPRPPVVDGGEDLTVCPGSPVTLTATGADSLAWNNGVTDGVPFFPEETREYVVTTWDDQGCSANDTVTVKVTKVNTNVTMHTDTLIALAGSDALALQWIRCEDHTPVDGATGAVFVPETGGSYAVAVTQGACTDTSVCLYLMPTGVGGQTAGEVIIRPNPGTGNFIVSTGMEHASLAVYNALGRLVFRKEDAAETERISLKTKGIYFLVIKGFRTTVTKKIIVY